MPTGNELAPEILARIRQTRDLLNDIIESKETSSSARHIPADKPKMSQRVPKLDFSMPIRPFIKMHSSGMSGAQKFTLLVAYLTKGDLKKSVSLAEVEREWNRMTNLLGGKFNGAHSGRARDNNLVETAEKAGLYRLRPDWTVIFR
jgi:hypothetical protein